MTYPSQTQKFQPHEKVRIIGKDTVYTIGSIHRVSLEYWYQLIETPDFLVRQSRLQKGENNDRKRLDY